jgi:hypothetical protein
LAKDICQAVFLAFETNNNFTNVIICPEDWKKPENDPFFISTNSVCFVLLPIKPIPVLQRIVLSNWRLFKPNRRIQKDELPLSGISRKETVRDSCCNVTSNFTIANNKPRSRAAYFTLSIAQL